MIHQAAIQEEEGQSLPDRPTGSAGAAGGDPSRGELEGREFDAVIIGGGVTGAAAARELSRWDISVALLEKESDLAEHASGRNDGMIHPGMATPPGTRKAYYNVRGNALYDQVTRELDVPFRRDGSLVLFGSPLERLLVPVLKARCRKNGVPGARYVSRKTVAEWEPNITAENHGAFFLPTAGQLSPYQVTVAMAENAVENGAEVFRETAVLGLEMGDGEKAGGAVRRVKTTRGTLEAGVVINAAGAWADRIAAMADDQFFTLHFRQGMDAILDVRTGEYQTRIAAMPHLLKKNTGHTKGGGLVPCVEGNILAGPTAVEIAGREDYSTDRDQMGQLLSRLKVNTALNPSQVITYFAGVRACTWEEDFIIEASRRVDNLVHLAGIQSPGLASAPAIAQEAARLAGEILQRRGPLRPRQGFNPRRRGIPRLNTLTRESRQAQVEADPAFGRVVCRCEGITEGEIREALRRPVPPATVDGIKRRTRAGTGRCHGGFCTPRILEIMAEEEKRSMTQITKKGEGSFYLWEETKQPASPAGAEAKEERR